MDENLFHAVCFFTRETGIMSSMSVSCGNRDRLFSAQDGLVNPNSLFDLASVTKLFTSLTVLRLREEGKLFLENPVTDYAPAFENLGSVTVRELLSFSFSLQTPGRIDATEDRNEALSRLFRVSVVGPSGKRAYSDIPAMVLKYVVEGASGMSFFEAVKKEVLEPADMISTFSKVPSDRMKDCLSYDREHRIEKGKYILRQGLRRGIPHDPKAAILCREGDDLCGHAGLFSTQDDMVRFCRALLAERIIPRHVMREMSVNRTGRRMEDGSWSQFLGYQCYLKHPDQFFSEIPAYMGSEAFGIAGFTGNHLSVDPERGIFALLLGNRVENRLTFLTPEEGKNLTDYGLNSDGTGLINWNDREKIYSSVNYVHQKDAHLHTAIDRALKGIDE